MTFIDILKAFGITIGITAGILLLFFLASVLSVILIPVCIFGISLIGLHQYREFKKSNTTKK